MHIAAQLRENDSAAVPFDQWTAEDAFQLLNLQ